MITHNEADKVYEFYLPGKTEEPYLKIQDHYFGRFHQTNLDNPHEICNSLYTTYRLIKSYLDMEEDNGITYKIEYLLFNDEDLMNIYKERFEELFEFEPQLENLTLNQIESMIKDQAIPEPPRKLVITRNDGLVFQFSQVSMAIYYTLKDKERKLRIHKS